MDIALLNRGWNRTRSAQLYAKVEFVRKNNKIVGYVISAVYVVLSGAVLFGGFMMLSAMGPIGMLAGAVLIADGMNGLTKEWRPLTLVRFSVTPGFIGNNQWLCKKHDCNT